MKKYIVSIFDGSSTTKYITEDVDIYRAENKIVRYHIGLKRNIIKVETTEIRD